MINSFELAALLDRQSGLATRTQLADLGVTPAALRANVAARRWRRVLPAVYATHTGPLTRLGELWAAVLTCGDGAVLSHESAGEVDGLVESRPGGLVHVTLPVSRRVNDRDGIRVHYLHRLPEARHPSRLPPRLRIEDTVLGLTDASETGREAMAWLLRACQRRLTTPEHLLAAMEVRKKMRWREALEGAAADALLGVQSLLEHRYIHRVEAAHGLPRGERQQRGELDGGRVWRDVRYRRFRTLAELDGRLGHEGAGRFRDMRRDNAATVEGIDTLRFGWLDVSDTGCEAAQQLVCVLRRNGWAGTPRSCSAECTIFGDTSMIMKIRGRESNRRTS